MREILISFAGIAHTYIHKTWQRVGMLHHIGSKHQFHLVRERKQHMSEKNAHFNLIVVSLPRTQGKIAVVRNAKGSICVHLLIQRASRWMNLEILILVVILVKIDTTILVFG